MKIKKRYAVLLTIGIIFIYNTYYPSWMITGSYTSNIVDRFATNGIDNNEKLEIYSDGTFRGYAWGHGTWKLEHQITGTRINFKIRNEGYNTYFYRKMFLSKPRLVIYRDLNSEFLKD